MKTNIKMPREYSGLLNSVLKVVDIAIILLSSIVSYRIKFNSFDFSGHYFYLFLSISVISIIIFNATNLYNDRQILSISDEITKLLCLWLIINLIVFSILFLLKIGEMFSREWIITQFILGLLLFLIFRIAVRLSLYSLSKKGFNQKHICLAISGCIGEEIRQKIFELENLGLIVSGVFSNNEMTDKKLKINGSLDDIEGWIKRNKPDQLWIVSPLKDEETIIRIINSANDLPMTIRYIPDLSGFNLINHSMSNINGIPFINIQEPPLNHVAQWTVKRTEDVVLSLIIIAIVSPLLLLIAILIKTTSKGPIFYKQIRLSYNNKPFYIIKFRTMPVNIESQTGAVWAKPGEKRATKLGALLRKTSLDELPQLLNVLRGDMSVVGPRPERPEFIKTFKVEVPNYMKKHMVKAGITGWAQVNGWRGDTDINKRIEYDIYYIRNWSVAFDLKIILMTILKGLINKNAY